MVRTGNNLPTGFLGPVKGWGSLVPAAESTLQLPRELLRWRSRVAAESEPSKQFELIELNALSESMGRVEDALSQFAGALADGGTLLCDFDNLQSARMLRMVIEGRPGPYDPSDSSRDPTQPLLLRRALHAAASAGLLVRDVLAVPSGAEEFAPELAAGLFDAGLLPLDWLRGTPPSRYWLCCEKTPSLAGSVVLTSGTPEAVVATQQALSGFLPSDWEVVVGQAVTECGQWNRAIAEARGEVLWFLRAGMLPSKEAFDALSPRACVGPVAVGCDGKAAHGGDVAGMMMPRADALLVGPLPEQTANTQVALEDHSMRLDAALPQALIVDVPLEVPRAPLEHPEQFERETRELLERWSVIQNEVQPGSAVEAAPEAAAGVPWAGRAPRISLCMIARDEEKMLGECLKLAKGSFDEFVLVDTGSKDRTVEIAESFGANVVHQPWDDDFSRPRNAALRAATGDWILVLDADEFLHEGGCERIRELVEEPRALGFHMRFTNNYGNGKTIGVMMVRLFRNLPGIEYQNVIHEQVTPSLQRLGGEMGLAFMAADVEVEHHGYADEVMSDRRKNERNERLFIKQIEMTPEDVYVHYKYGDFLRRIPGRGEDAKRYLDRCLELIIAGEPTLPRSLPYAGEVAALSALEAERAGESERAREVVEMALRRFVPTPNLHYLAASLALADEDAGTAIHHYRRCMSYRDKVLVVPIQEGITSYVSLAGIAQAWLVRGDRVRAQRMLEQAVAIEPSYEVAFMALSRLWLEIGDNQRALNVLTDYLADYPGSAGACQQTMLILQRLGHTDAAREMGQHAVRLLEARCLEREAAAVQDLLATL